VAHTSVEESGGGVSRWRDRNGGAGEERGHAARRCFPHPAASRLELFPNSSRSVLTTAPSSAPWSCSAKCRLGPSLLTASPTHTSLTHARGSKPASPGTLLVAVLVYELCVFWCRICRCVANCAILVSFRCSTRSNRSMAGQGSG
jgi:hypothetical protein